MNRTKHFWLYDMLFLLVLVLAGYLRLAGADWGEGQGQHPDENTFSGVLGVIRAQTCADETIPVDACPFEQRRWLSLGEYFDSQTSPLNPYNRGYGSFVYGNLPMNVIRVVADVSGQGDLRILGRQASAFADLFAIFFLYLIVARLYDRRVALLAALFSSLAVMQIQQSHFFTTDLFVNTFAFLAIYFAVEILKSEHQPDPGPLTVRSVLNNPLFQYSLGFGVAYGMALASKLNIYPLAVVLPGAFAVRWLLQQRNSQPVDGEQAGGASDAVPASLSPNAWLVILTCLVAGGFAAILAFRIFQPYAFDGLKPDPRWVADITQQRAQATGEADMPWNLQWARRSHLYSFTNMTVWGLGLPLGILAWIGFLYMGWRILKGEWQHALLWGWTAAYFGWQSLQFNPTMRYQLPIYPLLAMMAAWVVFELMTLNTDHGSRSTVGRVRSWGAAFVGLTVLLLTAAWAFAFHSIYLRDEPRIAASRWIYQNVPGPINLKILDDSASGYSQPLPYPNGSYILAGQPYQTTFTAQRDGVLSEISLAHVLALPGGGPPQLYVTVWQDLNAGQPLTSAYSAPTSTGITNDPSQALNFDQAPILNAGQTYYLKFEQAFPDGQLQVCGDMLVRLQVESQILEQVIEVTEPCAVEQNGPFVLPFVPQATGALNVIDLDVRPLDLSAFSKPFTLSLSIASLPGQPLAEASVTRTFEPVADPRGAGMVLPLERPVTLTQGSQYFLTIEVSAGAASLSGAAVVNETSFDYGLPMRTDGYDAFGGLYRGDLNLEVYWDDNPDKLNRFVSILDQTDYILIPTNHQYGQISRVPERYPLTAYYYRELMGCPPELETIPCYYEAQPGDHQGRLGFDLVAIFETYPEIGGFEINDQYAEEAFTFYDHPKVFIFKKNADFSAEAVRASLSTVDLTKVVRLLPKQFADYSDLLLPPDRLAVQRAGGTWSDLFDYDWVQNRYPVVGLIIWYVFIFLLGLAVYPIIRLTMPGLADTGYPLSRAFGLLLFGYFSWLSGSVGIPNTRLTIAVIFAGLLAVGGVLAYRQREALRSEWQTRRQYFFMVEGLFLLFFLIDLFIRMGNPDLWHPGKGGERPMDFSYFNAVIKSTSFPPYDPWFAGGYINYYYYGFVLVAMPVKLLGIVPSIAYNFILPTLFATVGICAFSLGWNLFAGSTPQRERADGSPSSAAGGQEFVAGLSASFLAVLLGNLGSLQLIHNKLQQMGALGTFTWDSTFAQRLNWTIEGLKLLFSGATLPIGPGDWYWDPSRVIPPKGGNEITEFPLFTFLYSDLHAHMIVMPIALLALSWALSVVAARAWKQEQAGPESERWWSAILSLVAGGLIIGAAYPTNLSDSYTYLLIGIVALAYSIWRYVDVSMLKRLGLIVGAVVALYGLSTYLYAPYRAWYAQAYSALDPWNGPYTPLASYFTHWGLFLLIIVSWLAWETREWMANTPLSALKKLKPYQSLIVGALIALVVVILYTQYVGTSVGWVALPVAAWAGALLLNPRLSDAKRLVLFFVGTGMFITVLVDVVVVRGDIGRANTIFKFYLQVWLMLAVSAGAMLAWLFNDLMRWLPGWRGFWQTGLTLLVAGAAMFTITGTMGKIRDRWIVDAPRTLDAMGYMAYANYDDFGQRLDLSEDYRAIRWMQENITGSPVIIEANCPEYRWCTRFTMYTGLPGVVGWNFHQRQQRVYTSLQVEERVASIGTFYNSLDADFVRAYLEKYDIRYIIVGQLERAAYTPEGIAKFEQFEGVLWQSVYRDGATAIYEVLP